MKNISTFLFMIVFLPAFVLAQAGAIELKSGNGTLISSHASIQEAYNAVPNPLADKYLIEITAAYTGAGEVFPITFGVKDSSSTEKNITLRPASGVTDVTVGGTASGQPIILLSNCDFVTIDGRAGGAGTSINLTIQNLATTSSSFTLRLLDGATYNIIRYVKVVNNTMNTAGPRGIEIGTSLNNTTGNSNNLITNCEIKGGRSGIGLAGTAANPNMKNTITYNKIYDYGYSAIWVLSSSNTTLIEGNEIYQTTGFSTGSYGIIAGAVINLDIIKNKIYDQQNTSSTTVRAIQIAGGAGAVYNVINNFISMVLDNGTKTAVTGIYISGSTEFTTNIYYNSIRIGGTHTGGTAGNAVSIGIQKASTGATAVFNVKNNIVLNTRTGGSSVYHTGFYGGATNMVGTMNIDYNAYYGADSTSYHSGWNGVLYNSLTEYKTAAAPNEQNSVFKPATFVSMTDLHLSGTSVSDYDLAGIPLQEVADDIDGNIRSLVMPYKGADEANVPIPVELTSFTAEGGDDFVNLRWSTATETNSSEFIIEKRYQTDNWETTRRVTAAGTSTEKREYNFADTKLTPGKYEYRLKMVDLDGSYSLSSVIGVEVGMPLAFSLGQNYPNPAGKSINQLSSTVINFRLPVPSKTTLMIYDISGRVVAEALNENLNAGSHSVVVNLNSLPSGVYFYRLTAGNFVQTRKMSLIR